MTQKRLIGTDLNQVPTNGMLGSLAFQDSKAISSSDQIAISTAGKERLLIRPDGNLCIGAAGTGHVKLEIRGPIAGTTGIPQTWGVVSGTNINGVAPYHNGFWSELNYGDTGSNYSITEGICYVAVQGVVSADLTSVFHQKGYVASGFNKGTYNTGYVAENFALGLNASKTAWGFYGGMDLETGNEKYNLYLAGDAYNYIRGNTGIGGGPNGQVKLYFSDYASRTSSTFIIASNAYIPKESQYHHSNYHMLYTESVAVEDAYTVNTAYGNIVQFPAANVGTNCTVTQYFANYAANNTAATSNYNYYGFMNTATGKNNWNVYADGTAPNYFASKVLVGTTYASDVAKLAVSERAEIQPSGMDIGSATYIDVGSWIRGTHYTAVFERRPDSAYDNGGTYTFKFYSSLYMSILGDIRVTNSAERVGHVETAAEIFDVGASAERVDRNNGSVSLSSRFTFFKGNSGSDPSATIAESSSFGQETINGTLCNVFTINFALGGVRSGWGSSSVTFNLTGGNVR